MRRRALLFHALTILGLAGTVPAARGATCYGVNSSGHLLTFQTGNPSAIQNDVAITGLAPSEEVIGCDIRPANGKLYLITVNSLQNACLYTVNPETGVATLIAGLSQKLTGGFFAMDFNPVVDRIRVISDSKQNVRVNPDTGEVITDVSIDYPAGDPGQGTFPALFSTAYSNNFAGAASTTLYGIDSGTDSLVTIDPANGGVLHTVGSLGVDTGGTQGFDIAPSPVNHAYATLNVEGKATLCLIDLATGHAGKLGIIGSGDFLKGFTVAPGYPQTAFSRNQSIRIVTSNHVGYQELNYNYETGQISVSPYNNMSGSVPRFFPFVEWTGVYHYDYGEGKFTQALYSLQDPL